MKITYLTWNLLFWLSSVGLSQASDSLVRTSVNVSGKIGYQSHIDSKISPNIFNGNMGGVEVNIAGESSLNTRGLSFGVFRVVAKNETGSEQKQVLGKMDGLWLWTITEGQKLKLSVGPGISTWLWNANFSYFDSHLTLNDRQILVTNDLTAQLKFALHRGRKISYLGHYSVLSFLQRNYTLTSVPYGRRWYWNMPDSFVHTSHIFEVELLKARRTSVCINGEFYVLRLMKPFYSKIFQQSYSISFSYAL